ncbi:MAG: ribonuclease Y [bacterium]|nr:ribonuclease Y [bacterium]
MFTGGKQDSSDTVTSGQSSSVDLRATLLEKLEAVSGMSEDEAKKLLLNELAIELKDEIARKIKAATDEAEAEIDKRSREILVEAMYHGATDYVPEHTTSTIRLPDEDMKGRIIGKEGRNIRAFEAKTGVDVDVDETPGEIRLSCFDPVRREIAKRSLEQLMLDGRIQPSRIEEVVEKTKKEVEKIMFEEGEKLCHTVDVFNLPKEIVESLGRFKYRYSYGQNMIVHTLEETKIGIAIANEIGADVNIVRLGCLLHDIGKVVGEDEGTHVERGVALLKRLRFPQEVIDCVAQHHEDEPFSSEESVVVYIADAISGSRPGARHEDIEEYMKRMGDLEEIASSFPGVESSFAIQAGREVRVFFKATEVDDAQMTITVRDIAKKIEDELKYPGIVKVVGIRESRAEAKAS